VAGVLVGAAVGVLGIGVAGWALWPRSRSAATEAARGPAAPSAPVAEPSPSAAALVQPTGALVVESEPAGARVSVNGEERGQTPVRLTDLPFASYTVKVERKGYESQSRGVTLSEVGAAGELRFVLARVATPQGEAEILSTPPGASVSVDGRPVGTTPISGLKLRPGTRRLDLALEGHEPWTGAMEVAAGKAGRVEASLQPLPRPVEPPTPEPVDTARVYENAAGSVDSLAKKLSGSSPSYPTGQARRLKSGERVSVLVRFVVAESGDVQDVSVVESGGKALDDVVVAAIRGWKFQPATRQGTRVKVSMTFKQTFLGG
jgi:TonB family protein